MLGLFINPHTALFDITQKSVEEIEKEAANIIKFSSEYGNIEDYFFESVNDKLSLAVIFESNKIKLAAISDEDYFKGNVMYGANQIWSGEEANPPVTPEEIQNYENEIFLEDKARKEEQLNKNLEYIKYQLYKANPSLSEEEITELAIKTVMENPKLYSKLVDLENDEENRQKIRKLLKSESYVPASKLVENLDSEEEVARERREKFILDIARKQIVPLIEKSTGKMFFLKNEQIVVDDEIVFSIDYYDPPKKSSKKSKKDDEIDSFEESTDKEDQEQEESEILDSTEELTKTITPNELLTNYVYAKKSQIRDWITGEFEAEPIEKAEESTENDIEENEDFEDNEEDDFSDEEIEKFSDFTERFDSWFSRALGNTKEKLKETGRVLTDVEEEDLWLKNIDKKLESEGLDSDRYFKWVSLNREEEDIEKSLGYEDILDTIKEKYNEFVNKNTNISDEDKSKYYNFIKNKILNDSDVDPNDFKEWNIEFDKKNYNRQLPMNVEFDKYMKDRLKSLFNVFNEANIERQSKGKDPIPKSEYESKRKEYIKDLVEEFKNKYHGFNIALYNKWKKETAEKTASIDSRKDRGAFISSTEIGKSAFTYKDLLKYGFTKKIADALAEVNPGEEADVLDQETGEVEKVKKFTTPEGTEVYKINKDGKDVAVSEDSEEASKIKDEGLLVQS